MSPFTMFLVAPLLSASLDPPPGPPGPRGGVELRLTAGMSRVYLDEPFFATVGAGLRVPIAGSLSFQPEVLFARGDRFDSTFAIAALALGLGRPGAARPYLVGGVGIGIAHDDAIDYTSHEVAWTGGLGADIALGSGYLVSPEARMGSDGLPRLTVSLAVPLGRPPQP